MEKDNTGSVTKKNFVNIFTQLTNIYFETKITYESKETSTSPLNVHFNDKDKPNTITNNILEIITNILITSIAKDSIIYNKNKRYSKSK